MVFPCEIQAIKIFHACLLVEGDKLIAVNIIYLENDVTIKAERLQNSTFLQLKLGHVHTYPEFFFPQLFFGGYENLRVHTQRIQMVWYPIVSGNEPAHNCDFGVISSAP